MSKNRVDKQASTGDTERVHLAGVLLVAAPDQFDPLFAQTVCMVMEHTREHAIGIVLNKPMALDPKPLWSQLFQGEKEPGLNAGSFHFGGPMNGPIVALHSDSTLAEGGNNHGVYLSAQVETLKKLAVMTPDHLRWFIGHLDWKTGELEQQIIEGKWHVLPAIPQLVFANEHSMWQEAIRWMGRSVIADMTGIEHFPVSPQCN